MRRRCYLGAGVLHNTYIYMHVHLENHSRLAFSCSVSVDFTDWQIVLLLLHHIMRNICYIQGGLMPFNSGLFRPHLFKFFGYMKPIVIEVVIYTLSWFVTGFDPKCILFTKKKVNSCKTFSPVKTRHSNTVSCHCAPTPCGGKNELIWLLNLT